MRPLIKSSQPSRLNINGPDLSADKLYPHLIKEYDRKQTSSQGEAFRKLRTYMANSPSNDQISHIFKDKSILNQSSLIKSFSKTNISFAFDRPSTKSSSQAQFFLSQKGVSPLRKPPSLDDSKEHSICKLKKSPSQLDSLPMAMTTKQKVAVSHFLFDPTKHNDSIEMDTDSREYLKPLRKSIITPSKQSTTTGQSEHIRTPSTDIGRIGTANTEIESVYKLKLDMKQQESAKAKLRRIGSSGTFKMQTRYEPGLGVVRSREGLDSSRENSEEPKEKKRFWFRLRNDICTKNKLKMRSEEKSRTIIKRIADNEEIIKQNKDGIMVCVDGEGNELEYCFVQRSAGMESSGDIGMNAILYEVRRKLKLSLHYRFLYLLSGEPIYELGMIPKQENILVISRQTELGYVDWIVQNELVREFSKCTMKKDITMYSQSRMESRMITVMETKQEMDRKYNDVLKVLDDEIQPQLNSGQLAYLVNSTKSVKMKDFTDKVHKVFHRKHHKSSANVLNMTSMNEYNLVHKRTKEDGRTGTGQGERRNKSYAEKADGSLDNIKSIKSMGMDEYMLSKNPISEGGKLNVYKEIMGYYKKLKPTTIDPQEPEEKFVGAVDSEEDAGELEQTETLGLVSQNLDGLLKNLKNSRKRKQEALKPKKEKKEAESENIDASRHNEEVHFAQSEQKVLEPETEDADAKKNFVQENISKLNTKKNDIHKLYLMNRELFLKNIPKYIKEKNLSRKELHVVYTLYKALSEVTSQRYKKYNIDDGIDYYSFRNGIYQVFLQSEELAEKVFYKIDKNFSGFLNWEEFLSAMVIIRAKTMHDKIDLFIKIADEDGNGCLSRKEIFDLAKICLGKFIKDTEDGFLKDLCEYFTKLIFESVGVSLDQEIPLQAIKDVITSQSEGSELLAMFCGADI